MVFSKATSVEELQVIGRLESLRKILLSDDYSDHLERPLSYWALPTDRRLPLAFLGRTLRDLLNTPLVELSATPGIGQKKMNSFVGLLARVADTDPSDLPVNLAAAKASEKAAAGEPLPVGDGFDPAAVSEVVWSKWQASVMKHDLGDEPLGRLAPSLRNMTRVVWNTPLSAYTSTTLAEIHAMKTHGEKRVNAILGVFHGVHALVSKMEKQDHLVLRIVPRLIDEVEQWTGRILQRPGVPSEEEIFGSFINPLLERIRLDAPQQITNLAENRLGITGPITSVRQASRTMGLTRARVYQLLNEINDIMNVRWPNGRHQVYELREKFLAEVAQMKNPPELKPMLAAIELFYPGSRRGAAGPMEQAPVIFSEDAPLIETEVPA